MSRPLAKLRLEGPMERLTIWVDEGLIEKLKGTFGEGPGTAMPEALRLGILAMKPEAITVTGPLGFRRPLARAGKTIVRDERARQALEKLRGILEGI